MPYWGLSGYFIFNLAAGDYLDLVCPTAYVYHASGESNSGAVFYLIG
jgi:hypothetical protein